MLHRPMRGRHFSRYAMGLVFLACGLLLATTHILAGAVFLALAAVVFYYAPRWDLRIEITGDTLRFSENVLEVRPLEIRFADLAEVRRVSERLDRKGFLALHPEYHPFVEFETKAGKTYRMHDIFTDELDEEILRLGAAAGVKVEDFPRDGDSPGEAGTDEA
jgi:hypothetical protein